MEKRNINEKFLCRYCGKDTSTFCGYWRLNSTEIYQGKRDNIMDSCYAHVECFIRKHKRILQLGITPLAISCPEVRTVKQAYALAKIHTNRRQIKNTIKFLQNVVERFEKDEKTKA